MAFGNFKFCPKLQFFALLEVLHEETLGIAEFHEVGSTLLEVLHKETLGIVEFHEVGKTLLEVLHEETLAIAEFMK